VSVSGLGSTPVADFDGRTDRRQRQRIHVTLAELQEIENARASLTTEFGRPVTLSEMVVRLARARNAEIASGPERRVLRRITPLEAR